MRKISLAAALLAAAASFVPSAHALPPIPDWPLGFTCHFTQLVDPTVDGYLFKVEGGPLLPVTDTGEQVTDVEVTCTLEVVPATYPARTLSGTSTNVGGVAYLAPMAERIPTGDDFTVRRCSHLTWTDSTGAARTGGSCG